MKYKEKKQKLFEIKNELVSYFRQVRNYGKLFLLKDVQKNVAYCDLLFALRRRFDIKISFLIEQKSGGFLFYGSEKKANELMALFPDKGYVQKDFDDIYCWHSASNLGVTGRDLVDVLL